MKTRILKLINDERTNVRITSKKGAYSECTGGAYDRCPSVSTDMAFCGTYAYDKCTKEDYAACQQGAHDECGYDYKACVGAGVTDTI